MGVRVLAGTYDGTRRAAAMVDSVTGTVFGPLFEAEDAAEQIVSFCQWLREKRWRADHALIFTRPTPFEGMSEGRPTAGDGSDPRCWRRGDLERLVSRWRETHVGEDGWLLDPLQCECGHRHMAGDDGEDAGCVSLCGCTRWSPGNPLAERHAAAGEEVLA